MPGTRIEDFQVATTGGTFRLSALGARLLVLYFYPRDNTPGCTNEAADFRDLYPKLKKAGAEVLGVSRDSLRSHEGFKAKMRLPFELASDAEGELCARFGVLKSKTLYGRPVRGIERSTFVLRSDGALLREWRGVKVAGHAKEVLDFVQTV